VTEWRVIHRFPAVQTSIVSARAMVSAVMALGFAVIIVIVIIVVVVVARDNVQCLAP